MSEWWTVLGVEIHHEVRQGSHVLEHHLRTSQADSRGQQARVCTTALRPGLAGSLWDSCDGNCAAASSGGPGGTSGPGRPPQCLMNVSPGSKASGQVWTRNHP